jgi:hypothetical protein
LTGNRLVLARFDQKVTIFGQFLAVLGVTMGKIAESAQLLKGTEIGSSKFEIRNKFEIQILKMQNIFGHELLEFSRI